MMDVGKNFSRGALADFPNVFLQGPKVVKVVFYHLKLRKQHFLLNFSIPASLPTPICLCAGNVRATRLKNLGNFKHFNTIPNSEILPNLIRKMKYLTNQFQLFLYWQR